MVTQELQTCQYSGREHFSVKFSTKDICSFKAVTAIKEGSQGS